ncbi:hypothetical protein BZM27_50605 [Paraburkholderia steynii]|uniref:Uncharacterized protein n=1 Tax=Paraburkholderia steynii TaxID=1245441 RepID=A0A4R0X024_9BURK|nr:hypothetical protein BZM27_50605 [Paraburkholderia steynii]
MMSSMQSRRSSGRLMNMSAGLAKERKSMAAVACAVGALSDNWLVNRATLISRAKSAVPFTGVSWDSPIWDVSKAYQHRTRGYKAGSPAQRLLLRSTAASHARPDRRWAAHLAM